MEAFDPDRVRASLARMPAHERVEVLRLLEQWEETKKVANARVDFLAYVKEMWPGFIAGRHHKIIAEKFNALAEGKIKRLMIHLPPRHTKSEFGSKYLPSWYLGLFPDRKIIQASNTAELAQGFGRQVRNIVDSPEYKRVFPGTELRADSKAAGRWDTNHQGSYFAIGVGGTMTGRGADLLIIDDPHNEREAAQAEHNPEIYDSVYEWYTSGPRQRLQPSGAILLIMCMTGDTEVLMADGTVKPLVTLRVGDSVATYEHGRLTTSRVNNWRLSGVDTVYKIITRSGRSIRANERHPFLVEVEGEQKWVQLQHLKPGMALVSLMGAHNTQKHSCAPLSTYGVTLDPILSIQYDGSEDVYDVEIDRTENFIANGVVSHNTKWSKRDLAARILKESAQRGGDKWEVIEFPAIFEAEGVEGEPGYRPERSLWPEYWPLPELQNIRSTLPLQKWQAQYQQNPTSDAAAIVKREWWRRWEADKPPPCEYLLLSMDTAFEKTNRADYSAFLILGVFYRDNEETGRPMANVILLNAFRDKLEFPQLKAKTMEQYKRWEPDGTIIEKKASGAPLIYELRAMGVPVQEFTPSAGNDKIARLNAVADMFASGMVWAPNTYWAEEVIEEVASFPSGDHDDYVDALSMGLNRIRRGGFIRVPSDIEDDEFIPVKRRYY